MDCCSHISPPCSLFACQREPGMHSRHMLLEEIGNKKTHKWIKKETMSDAEEEDETVSSCLWGEWGLLGPYEGERHPYSTLRGMGWGLLRCSGKGRGVSASHQVTFSRRPHRKVSQMSGPNWGCHCLGSHCLLNPSGILENVLTPSYNLRIVGSGKGPGSHWLACSFGAQTVEHICPTDDLGF